MKTCILFFLMIFFTSTLFAQSENNPVAVTPVIEKKINTEIEKEVQKFSAQLKKEKETDVSIEFSLDTFRIEKYQEKYMEYDWSTAGMRFATYDAASKYDSLLNKYYKKLLAVLKDDDKTNLINAQRAWIAFRDSELKLITTISKDEYSGGGTMQQLIDASEYLDIIEQRTVTIYQHYLRATQRY